MASQLYKLNGIQSKDYRIGARRSAIGGPSSFVSSDER